MDLASEVNVTEASSGVLSGSLDLSSVKGKAITVATNVDFTMVNLGVYTGSRDLKSVLSGSKELISSKSTVTPGSFRSRDSSGSKTILKANTGASFGFMDLKPGSSSGSRSDFGASGVATVDKPGVGTNTPRDWRKLFQQDQTLNYIAPSMLDEEAVAKPPTITFEQGEEKWRNAIVAQFIGFDVTSDVIREDIKVHEAGVSTEGTAMVAQGSAAKQV
ncbi:hypothetical protein PTKIN_Ptkin16aG0059700 [Pterospermum kingtungense]